MATTNKEILEAVREQSGELVEIKEHLVQLNGTVAANDERSRENKTKIDSKPCAAVQQDVAVLKDAVKRHGINWTTVLNLGLALLQAVILYLLLR